VDNAGTHEIARAIKPFTSLTPASCSLAAGYQPLTFDKALTRVQSSGKISIG
jgi:hypothetical protein